MYDGLRVPSVFKCYKNTIIVSSYSKDLSLAGERIGFIAVSPQAAFQKEIVDGLIFCNRILGFVNAPATFQRIISELQGVSVDIKEYERKRDRLCEILGSLGFKFIKELRKFNILAVPGIAFGLRGYFRLAFCVDDTVIEGAFKGFKEVSQKYIKRDCQSSS